MNVILHLVSLQIRQPKLDNIWAENYYIIRVILEYDLWVESWLCCIEHLPCVIGFLVMWRFGLRTVYIGGSLRVKLNLACQKGAKMSLALNEPEYLLFI